MNMISIKSTELLSKYFGETEGTVRRLFRQARAASPSVLFFDDFDCLATSRYISIMSSECFSCFIVS